MSEKNFILPILCLYCLNSIAAATHMSKNEDKERISYTIDNDSVSDDPGIFTTYEVIGYDFTYGNTENEK